MTLKKAVSSKFRLKSFPLFNEFFIAEAAHKGCWLGIKLSGFGLRKQWGENRENGSCCDVAGREYAEKTGI